MPVWGPSRPPFGAGRFQMGAAGPRRRGWYRRGRHEVNQPGGRRGTSGRLKAYGAGERVGAADWLELLGAAVELSGSSATSM